MHTKQTRLSPELLRHMHAYWRAANYLSVGQIYLEDQVLPVGPTGEVSVRISRPQQSSSLPPSMRAREYQRRCLSNLQTQAEN